MMHGHEKSDLVIVAMKPANKAKEAHCGGVCGGERSGVGGAKGGGQGEYAPAQHVLDPEPGSRDKRAGAYTASFRRHTPEVEPYAGKPHVRFCAAGRAMKRTSLPLKAATKLPLIRRGLPFLAFRQHPSWSTKPRLPGGAFSCGSVPPRSAQPTVWPSVELAGLPLMLSASGTGGRPHC